jgi:hypothetical protein
MLSTFIGPSAECTVLAELSDLVVLQPQEVA